MKYVYAVLIVVALFALVIWSYRANKRIPVPKGCENLHPDCKACGLTDCELRSNVLNKIEEELKKDGNS